MLTSFDAGPDGEESQGASKRNSQKVYQHRLQELGSWHDRETEDGNDADKVAQGSVFVGDRCGLIEGRGYGGRDGGSADSLRHEDWFAVADEHLLEHDH